jgi:hypothetical protein
MLVTQISTKLQEVTSYKTAIFIWNSTECSLCRLIRRPGSLSERLRRKVRRKFPNTACPSGDTISKLVKKVRINGILIDRKLLKRNHVLIEEKLDDISHRLENSS